MNLFYGKVVCGIGKSSESVANPVDEETHSAYSSTSWSSCSTPKENAHSTTERYSIE